MYIFKVYSPFERHTSQGIDINGDGSYSSSSIQHLRALQYTIYLEDWVCTRVVSANVDKRITAVKFILALVCLDTYEDLMVELSHPNSRSSLGMSEHIGMMITVPFMVTVYVTHSVYWCHQHAAKVDYIKLLFSLSSFVVQL